MEIDIVKQEWKSWVGVSVVQFLLDSPITHTYTYTHTHGDLFKESI